MPTRSPEHCTVRRLSPLPSALPRHTSARKNTHKKGDLAIRLVPFDNNINYFSYELISSRSEWPEALLPAISSSLLSFINLRGMSQASMIIATSVVSSLGLF